jgi:hypothetical protein
MGQTGQMVGYGASEEGQMSIDRDVRLPWWFRRCLFFRQTNGQVLCGGIAMVAVVIAMLAVDEMWFRTIIAFYFGFKAFDEIEQVVKTDPNEQ